MDTDGYAVRTLSGRTDAQRAHSRAGHIGRADAERKDHPLVRLLRPADSSALWPGQPVHRVHRVLTVPAAGGRLIGSRAGAGKAYARPFTRTALAGRGVVPFSFAVPTA